MVLLWL